MWRCTDKRKYLHLKLRLFTKFATNNEQYAIYHPVSTTRPIPFNCINKYLNMSCVPTEAAPSNAAESNKKVNNLLLQQN